MLPPSDNQVDKDEELDHSIVWKLLAVEDHELSKVQEVEDHELSKVQEVGEGHLVEEVEV